MIIFENPHELLGAPTNELRSHAAGDENPWLVGYVYSRKAGRAVFFLEWDGKVEAFRLYDSNGIGAFGKELLGGDHLFWTSGGMAVHFLGMLELVLKCESERMAPTFSDRFHAKKYRGLGIRPRPYYVLRRPRYRGPRKGNPGSKLTHRHRRCAHDRLTIRYLPAQDVEPIEGLRQSGFEVYTRRTLTGSVIASLADRGKRMPGVDEIVAIKTTRIRECVVGDESLPFRSTLRVVT